MAIFDIMPCVFTRAWITVVAFVSESWAYFYYWACYFVLFFYVLVLLETSCIRLLIDWKWKRPPPVIDDFFFAYLTVLNFTLSLVFTAMNALAKDDLKLFYNVQGIQELPDTDFGKFRVDIGNKVGAFALSFVWLVVISKMVRKAKSFWANRKKATAVIVDNQSQSRIGLNNALRNKEVFGGTVQFLFLISFLLVAIPFATLVIFADEKHLSLEEEALLELCTSFFLYFLLPLFFYIRNPRLRSHTWLRLNDLLHF